MNDHPTPPTIDDAVPADHPLGQAAAEHDVNAPALTLDELMQEARLVERTARICIRGDLDDRHQQLIAELAELVDEDGHPLDDDDSDRPLGEPSPVQAKFTELQAVKAERAKWMRSVRFRAMPDDEWRVFEKENRGPDGEAKDRDDYSTKIIARCAIEPAMTEADVAAMRKKLTGPQMTALFNAAWLACATGGLDVPKSPSFLHGLQHTQSAKS